MTVLCFVPVVLSFLVLGAHFLRSGDPPLAAACVLLPWMLVIRRPWAARLLQGALLLGAAVWIRTLVAIAVLRARMGDAWLRMAVILGVVAAVAILSALLFQGKTLGRIYGTRERRSTS
jgi:hypothetical protein